jgi:outer membrane biosynthesis protein TonB
MGLTSLAIKSTLNSSLSDKKKSLILATILYCILLCILFLIRFWPPSDAELLAMAGGGGGGGVTVNFGDTEFGSGKDFDSKELDVKSINKAVATQETPQEDIISQDADADKTDVVIEKHEPIKKPKIAIKTEVVKPVEVKKPEVKKVDDAVANLLHGNKKGGDGTSSTSGNQGRSNGDINSNGYSGSGGSGEGSGGGKGSGNGNGNGAGNGSGSGGGNGSGNGKGNGSGYDLGNRKPLNKPQPDYNCGNEYGKVVVQITVDKNGNVTQAIPGYKGSKTLDSCLMAEAKKAALKTKWQSSPDGSDKQVGTIIYVFEIKN